MDKKVEISMLCDIYGKLLTEKQFEFINDYYNNDLSLSEIAENNKEKEERDKTIADDKNDNGKEYPINMPPLPNKEKNVD